MSEHVIVETLPSGIPEEVPAFPLLEHVLLPGSLVPYRIFEPRYRALMEYLLGLPEPRRWLAVPQLVADSGVPYEERPPFYAVATVALLERSTRNRDGTFHIVVGEGIRCRLLEVPSPHPFRLVRPEPWSDLPGVQDPERAESGLESVQQVVAALVHALGPGARGLLALAQEKGSIDQRVFRLANALLQHPQRRQELLECRDPVRRTEMLLDAAATLLTLAGAQDGNLPRS